MADSVHFLLSIPEIISEASLAIYLTFKGFSRASPLLARGPAAVI